MNAKIRDFANQKVPYILVFGDKEEAANSSQRSCTRQRRPELQATFAAFLASESLIATSIEL